MSILVNDVEICQFRIFFREVIWWTLNCKSTFPMHRCKSGGQRRVIIPGLPHIKYAGNLSWSSLLSGQNRKQSCHYPFTKIKFILYKSMILKTFISWDRLLSKKCWQLCLRGGLQCKDCSRFRLAFHRLLRCRASADIEIPAGGKKGAEIER